jgi:hypothetical protein
MIKNIACRFSQEDVQQILDDAGLKGTYEDVYIPRGCSGKSNLGYAFVQFAQPVYAEECQHKLDGRVLGNSNTTKLCKVVPAHRHGLPARKGAKLQAQDFEYSEFMYDVNSEGGHDCRNSSKVSATTADPCQSMSMGSSSDSGDSQGRDAPPRQLPPYESVAAQPYVVAPSLLYSPLPSELSFDCFSPLEVPKTPLEIKGIWDKEAQELHDPWMSTPTTPSLMPLPSFLAKTPPGLKAVATPEAIWRPDAVDPPDPMLLPNTMASCNLLKPPPGLAAPVSKDLSSRTPHAQLSYFRLPDAVKPEPMPRADALEFDNAEEKGDAGSETTVMLRNIACRYTEDDVMCILDQAGLAGTYDFVYLPQRTNTQSNLGYAFVNFFQQRYVDECTRLLGGKAFGWAHTTKRCQVSMARLQGSKLSTFGVRQKKRRAQVPSVSTLQHGDEVESDFGLMSLTL